jgi:chromosome segregation ATPase
MATTETIGEGLTFEKVWAAIQATNEQIKETDRIVRENAQRIRETGEQMKETDRRMKETDRIVKETGEQMKETDRRMKETDRRMKETDERFGALSNRFGEMVEYMILPNLVEKFGELGFTFTKANRTKITDREHGIFTEIDAYLETGEKVMVVEIKNKPSVEDINDHIERMEKLRQYADLHDDKRKYLGAMAGVVFSESVKTYTLKKGFYVIEPSGDTFTITEPKGSYHPQEW